MIEVYNKIDRLDRRAQSSAGQEKGVLDDFRCYRRRHRCIAGAVSAREIDKRFFTRADYTLKLEDGKSLAWLHAHGKVVEQRVEEDYIHVTVQLSADNIRRFESLHHASCINYLPCFFLILLRFF